MKIQNMSEISWNNVFQWRSLIFEILRLDTDNLEFYFKTAIQELVPLE
jgi:hypothetical protein